MVVRCVLLGNGGVGSDRVCFYSGLRVQGMHGVVLYLRWIDRGVVRLLGKRPGMYEPGQRSVLPRSLRETGGLVTI